MGVEHAYGLGRELNELSERTGVTAGHLMVLRQAFEDAGAGADQVGPAINKMQRFLENASDGGAKSSQALSQLGLNLQQILALSPDQQFAAIGKAISQIPDPARRAAEAMAIFGKSGGRFLALFESGGGLGQAAVAIGRQAKLLDENAGVFQAISVKLGYVGLKLQGFFVGVAARLSGTILPLLDKFQSLDLSSIGEKFGDGLIRGAQFVVGAFQNPKAFIGVATDAFVYGMMQAGNVLIAAIKTARTYFQDGMLETIQGIGDVLLGTLLKAFAVPIAYLQAGIDQAMASIPKALGGSGEKEAAQAEYAKSSDKLARLYNARAAEAADNNPALASTKAATLASYDRDIAVAKALNDFNFRKAQGNTTLDERAQSYLANGGPVISTARGDRNADQLIAQGGAGLQYGLGRAGAAVQAASIQDVLGAGKYKAAMQGGFTAIANAGGAALARSIAPKAMIGGVPVSDAYKAQLIGTFGHEKANELMYGKDEAALMNKRAPISAMYRSQLIDTYGKAAVEKMLTTGGALISATSAPGRRPTAAGMRGLFGDTAGGFASDRARLHLQDGLRDNGGLHRGAYDHVRRGDANRAKAEAARAKKEAIHIGGISADAAKAIGDAVGKELEVSEA